MILTTSDIERFWKHVSIPEDTNGCWLWLASTNPKGYGYFNVFGDCQLAHRVSATIHTGPIPKGTCCCHRCDNPPCVNPNHLFLGTLQDNNRDMFAKGRYAVLRGEKAGRAKLSTQDVLGIRARYREGKVTISVLASEFGVTATCINYIVYRKNWRHVA